MSLGGLKYYTQPLSLIGDVTIKENLNAKNVYVNGILTGGGISTNILGTDNTWTGTNQYNNTTSYTGSTYPVTNNNDLTNKNDVDDLATSYNSGALNPTLTNNTWTGTTTWNNLLPPTVPYFSSPANNKLVGFSEMINYIQTYPTINNNSSNDIRGSNTFTLNPSVSNIPSLLIPTQDLQLASKAYVDAKIEVSGKTLTYTITTPGTYNFSFINRANIVGIEFILFGASYGGALSGSVYSGKIGNANGIYNSLFLSVGTKNPTTNYSSYNDGIVSNTYLKVGNEYVGIAGGACLLNGISVPGSIISSTNSITGTGTCNGRSGDNLFKYSNILGTTTSNGGAILVAYYI